MSLHDIGAAPADLAFLVRAAAAGATLRLAPGVRDRLERARRVVERYARGDEPVYGLNTGLGGNLAFRLSPAEIEAFQVQMVRGRCIGVGDPFSEAVSRTILLCRIVGLAKGGGGISPGVLDAMVALYNAGLSPVIPGRGSIGAGDLGLCAPMAAVLIGRGEVWARGRRRPAAEALAEAGLAPAALGAKDGLGLLNCSAVSAGHAAAVLASLCDVLFLSAVAAGLSFEGYAANVAIFDARLAAARPARGQEQAAALFRAVLAGSFLHVPGAARSIQDALSFRTLSQTWGPALSSLRTAALDVETEIDAVPDNPLVLAEDGLILSTANFHTPAIALAFDTLAIVNLHLATASAYRIAKLMDARLTGLPKYLSPVGGASNGLNSLQKTAAALHGEIRLKATPASLDCLPVSEGVEDHAPQTPLAIRKLGEQVDLLRMLAAVEALVAAQAVDLRGRPRLAPMTGRLFSAIRARVPAMVEDRETGWDADAVIDLLAGPHLAAELRAAILPEMRETFGLLAGFGGAD